MNLLTLEQLLEEIERNKKYLEDRGLLNRIKKLEKQSSAPDFWQNFRICWENNERIG